MTDTQKLAIMEFDDMWEPALPLSPASIGLEESEQLLWGYPGLGGGAPPDLTGGTFKPCIRIRRR